MPRHALALLPVSLSALCLFACGNETEETENATPNGPVTPSIEGVTEAKSSLARELAPAVDDATVAQLTNAQAAFALDLLPYMAAQSGNAFYSPVSIHQALTMATAGALGDTLTEMRSTLRVDTLADAHAAQNALDLSLAAAGNTPLGEDETGDPLALEIANSLWGDPAMVWKQPFLDTLAVNYGAGLQLTDFESDPEAARALINAWVAEQTRDRIPDLLPGGSITDLTRMVMVNAIFFKGSWSEAFAPEATGPAPFARGPGDAVDVDMMHANLELAGFQGEGFVAARLPYAGRRASMLLVVPDDLEAFEAGLDAAALARIVDGLQTYSVNLALPTFEMKIGKSLKDTLKALGMVAPFEAADFSGMTESDDLTISDVIHQAFVKVDEEGTEAAAATAVVFEGTTSVPEPPPALTVHADKPFLFIIRDDTTGAPLFIGRIADPTAAE